MRPLLEYNTPVWSPQEKTLIDVIERVQRYFTRRLCFKCNINFSCYADRLIVLNLQPLEIRRLYFDLKMVYKICNNLVDLNFTEFFEYAPRVGLRGHNYKLYKNYCRLNVFKFAFSNRIIEIWNSLPQEIVNANTVKVFDVKLKNFNLTNYCKFNRNQ